VRSVVVDRLQRLAASGSTRQGCALARLKLDELRAFLADEAAGSDVAETASRRWLAASIARFLEGKDEPKRMPALPAPPPGEPIGGE